VKQETIAIWGKIGIAAGAQNDMENTPSSTPEISPEKHR
jgi:hypothetical protein